MLPIDVTLHCREKAKVLKETTIQSTPYILIPEMGRFWICEIVIIYQNLNREYFESSNRTIKGL